MLDSHVLSASWLLVSLILPAVCQFVGALRWSELRELARSRVDLALCMADHPIGVVGAESILGEREAGVSLLSIP